PFLHHVVDGTVDEGLVGDAAGEGPDGPARLFAKRLQRVSIQIDRPHLSTEANDQLRDLAPDTLSRSRYQDATTFKTVGILHAYLPHYGRAQPRCWHRSPHAVAVLRGHCHARRC